MPDLIRTLRETAHYPPHPPRAETPLYAASHHQLVYIEDRPCLVCGVRNSTLADPTHNRWGATALETHHRIVEDSLALAVDLSKFNARVLPGLLRTHPDKPEKYGHPFSQDEMLTWIHGDADHLWVICSVHHRHPLVGIHAITYPIWTAQDLLLDSFDLTGFHAASPQDAAALTALPTTVGTASAPTGVPA